MSVWKVLLAVVIALAVSQLGQWLSHSAAGFRQPTPIRAQAPALFPE